MKLFRITRTRSKCNSCPLSGYCTKVRGESVTEKPKIAFIGEAPGKDEDAQGHPFVGSAGQELDRILAKAGIHRHNAYLTNMILCRPPENNLSSPEGVEAVESCRPGFEEELLKLYDLGVRVLVPLGANPTASLGIEGSIHKVRGSVYDVAIQNKHFWAIPTFHPSFIIRGEWSEEPTCINDIEKAVNIAQNGYTPPKEDFLLFPKVRDIELRAKDILKRKPLIGVDTETTALTYYDAEIFVMSLALSGEEAISIPFYSQGFIPYWHNGDLARVKNCVASILEKCPTMYQNAPYDVSVLEANGYRVGNIAHDVLLIHHAIHPELPHNLGYIVSIYGATPYWKDIKLKFPMMRKTPDIDLRTYNCRDSVVLHQVLNPLLQDLKETGTEHIYYDYELKLIRPTLSITYNGMLLDTNRLRGWKRELSDTLQEQEHELRQLGNLPEKFNFQSPHHLSYWLYGELPRSYDSWKRDLDEYEANSKKRKDTKKYAELQSKISIYANVTPLARSKSRTKRNKTGFAKDEKALLLSRLAATTEIDLISKFRRPTVDHKRRLVELEKLRSVLVLFQKRQETAKMLSTYTEFPTARDGRVHPRFAIHGTATGRLSSDSPNWQNIPSDAKKLFTPEKGYALVQGDFSNLELRVQSYEWNDAALQKMFAEGKNIHDENTKVMFGITPDNPNWKHIRRAAKIAVFGRGYGGGIRGIFERVAAEVPELSFTMAQFKNADRKFFEAHPGLLKGMEKASKTAVETRCCTTATGRKRFFLGTPEEVEREGINTPIQSVAGDIESESLIELYTECEKRKDWKLVATVHDSNVIECPIEDIDECAKVLKSVMEKPRHLWNRVVSFPADIEVSTKSWKEMESYEDWKKHRERKDKAARKSTRSKAPKPRS